MEPKPAVLTGSSQTSSRASGPHKRYSVEPKLPSAQAQLNTVAQAALLFLATHEDPGCITEFWARVVL